MRKTTVCMAQVPTRQGVRRIPISNISLTGEVLGAEFESALERDLILKFAWAEDLNWFQTQPLTVHYTDSTGAPRQYTPDLLVNFLEEFSPHKKPILCEVKYRKDLREFWPELRPKFKAAIKYCREHGMTFRIFDEHRIRTPRLRNIQFLWRYRHSDLHQKVYERVINAMRPHQQVRLCEVIDAGFHSTIEKGEAIWSFWVGVAHGHILCDLDQPINSETVFWLADWRRAAYFGDQP